MYNLDNRTILLLQVIIGVIISIFSIITSKRFKENRSVTIKIGNLFYILGFFILSFQGRIPRIYSVVLSNSGILLFFILSSYTISAMLKSSIDIRFFIILFLLNTLGFIYFLYIKESTLFRIYLISISIIITLVYSIIKTLSIIRRDSLVLIFFSAQLFYIISSLIRIIATTYLHYDIKSIFNRDISTSIIFISSIIYHLSINIIFYLILISESEKRLIDKLKLIKGTYQDIRDLNGIFNNSQRYTLEASLYIKVIEIIQKRFKISSILIYKKFDKEIKMVSFSNIREWLLEKIHILPVDKTTITGRAIIDNLPQTINIKDYPDNKFKSNLIDEGYIAFVSYPIRSYKGVYGAITLGLTTRNIIINEDIKLLLLICNHFGSILENANLYTELQSMAVLDPLTEIYNRRSFDRELEQAITRAKRYNWLFSILMIDIDHFKSINDDYGHDIGDFILKACVNIIKDCLRTADYFARYGGEEFVVILNKNSTQQGFNTAERIRKKIEENIFKNDNLELKITISCGISEFDLKIPDKTLKNADKALYIAKSQGRNRTIIWGDSPP